MAARAEGKRTLLVTGAAGALAQQVIRRLSRERYEVVAVDFRHEPEIESGVASYRLDFNHRNFEDIFRKHSLDAVLHLGRIESARFGHFHRYNANVLGTQNLINLSRYYGVGQMVILSTYFVYGAHAYNPALLREEAPLMASQLTTELADAVELESLASVNMWKYPELNITTLRPSNIAGPGVLNAVSRLLMKRLCPVMLGFSPLMQLLHVEDMADAVVLALEGNVSGIYNVTLDDYVPWQDMAGRAGCRRLPVPSIPPVVPRQLTQLKGVNLLPSYLVDYLKYPVVIDGGLFDRTFGFRPRYGLTAILDYYRALKAD